MVSIEPASAGDLKSLMRCKHHWLLPAWSGVSGRILHMPRFQDFYDYTQTTSFWGSQADGCLLRQGSGGVHRNGRFLGLRHTKGDRPWTRSCS